MNKVKIIRAEIEIVKIKALLFLAIASGSCMYAFKVDDGLIAKALYIAFVIRSHDIAINVLKLSDLHDELKGLK